MFLLAIGAGCSSVDLNEFDAYSEDDETPFATTNGAPDFVDLEPPVPFNPEWLKPPTNDFTLGPADEIAIELLGEDRSLSTTFVMPDGKIYFHLAPGVDVWDLTVKEAEAAVSNELKAYIRDPRVVITIEKANSRRVAVMGRLAAPGVFNLEKPTTVLEAISRAGGLFTSRFTGTTEELADLHHSFLIREGEMLPIDFQQLVRGGDTSQNVYLQADDYIYIPSALSQEVYILGAVTQPRAVGFKDQLTIIQAVAQAKGTLKGAWLKEIAIVRGSLTEPKIARVNLQAILEGRAPNVKLRPRDIIYVPRHPQRHLHKYARLAVDTFVRTVAANEGSIAGGGGQLPVNLSVGGR